jgi:hypothetical protein
MARCDQGYLCDVCGVAVDAITESELYLKFALGIASAADLATARDRHIACNPLIAQYIIDDRFPPVVCPEPFNKANLDATIVASQEIKYTAAYRLLHDMMLPQLLNRMATSETRS